jgi:hypothetical protein
MISVKSETIYKLSEKKQNNKYMFVTVVLLMYSRISERKFICVWPGGGGGGQTPNHVVAK